MSVEERREARRRRILENSENRLKKITTLSTTENVLNGHANLIKDEQGDILNFKYFNNHKVSVKIAYI